MSLDYTLKMIMSSQQEFICARGYYLRALVMWAGWRRRASTGPPPWRAVWLSALTGRAYVGVCATPSCAPPPPMDPAHSVPKGPGKHDYRLMYEKYNHNVYTMRAHMDIVAPL